MMQKILAIFLLATVSLSVQQSISMNLEKRSNRGRLKGGSNLTDEKDIAYYMTIYMGSSRQPMVVQMDTGSDKLIVMGDKCSQCTGSKFLTN